MKSQERGLQTEIQNIIVNELRAVEKRLATQIDGVEKRLDARMDSKLDIQTESLKGYIDSKISQVNLRFDIVDRKFDIVDRKFANVDRKFTNIDKKFANIDKNFAHMDVRFDALEKQLKVNTAGLVEMFERRSGEIINIEHRLTVLETKH